MGQLSATGKYAQRAIAYYNAARALLKQPLIQRMIFFFAALIFAAGITISLWSRPELVTNLSINHILFLGFVFAPVLVLLNTSIFLVTCRVVSAQLNFFDAMKVSVLSSAANYLPLPAGPALRIIAMTEKGASLKGASFVNIAAALVWFGATFIHAGFWASLLNPAFCIILVVIGACSLAGGVLMVWSINHKVSDVFLVTVVSIGAAVFYAFGFWVSLSALGFEGAISQAVVISIAGVIGAAVSFVPSGLGVRELAAAYIATLVIVDPATGFIASAILQITTIAPLVLIAIFFSIGLRPLKAD